jgi:ABC-type sugar transport system ATPase subunit
VFALADRITVLKDGALVKTVATSETDSRALVNLMVGRELDGYFPPRGEPGEFGEVRLAVNGLSTALLDDVSLQVRAGEIVGLAGLQGSGRTEIARAIFGADPVTAGTVELDGKPVKLKTPRAAIKAGLGFITEDRKLEGLALAQSIQDNMLLAARTVIPGARRRKRMPGLMSVKELAAATDLRARGPEQEVRFLSGGNQQKVVLAKWLETRPQVLIFDEPTRGIDVGAKAGIHDLIRKLAREGVAVLMISSELPELIGMADRILVMHEGSLAGELPAGAGESDIMALATGTEQAAA